MRARDNTASPLRFSQRRGSADAGCAYLRLSRDRQSDTRQYRRALRRRADDQRIILRSKINDSSTAASAGNVSASAPQFCGLKISWRQGAMAVPIFIVRFRPSRRARLLAAPPQRPAMPPTSFPKPLMRGLYLRCEPENSRRNTPTHRPQANPMTAPERPWLLYPRKI